MIYATQAGVGWTNIYNKIEGGKNFFVVICAEYGRDLGHWPFERVSTGWLTL